MYMTVSNPLALGCPDCATEQPDTLYWVEVGSEQWAQWPAWLCRRSGIDPNGLLPVEPREAA